MNDYTNFRNLDELNSFIESDTSKIMDSVQNRVDSSIFEMYREKRVNNWFNEINDYDIKTMYYKKILSKNDKKPTKLKDMVSPGIKFEEDVI